MKLHNIGKKYVKAWGIFLLMALAVGGCKNRNESLTLLNRQSTLGASNRLKGDGLAIFSQDPQTGLLQDTGQGIHVPHPVFVTLTPTDHV